MRHPPVDGKAAAAHIFVGLVNKLKRGYKHFYLRFINPLCCRVERVCRVYRNNLPFNNFTRINFFSDDMRSNPGRLPLENRPFECVKPPYIRDITRVRIDDGVLADKIIWEYARPAA